MIYSAFNPILALHIVNFSSCQNYWGGGQTICLPPPHISTLFLSVHLGVLPPQYQKAGYASAYTPPPIQYNRLKDNSGPCLLKSHDRKSKKIEQNQWNVDVNRIENKKYEIWRKKN